MHGQIDQVFTVVKRYNLNVRRKYLFVQVRDLVLQRCNHFSGILPFAHHDDAFHHIVLQPAPHLSQTRQMRLVHIRKVLHQNRSPVDIFHHDIADLPGIVNQTDTAHGVRLRVFRDYIAAHVDITLRNGIEQLERRDAITGQLMRVYAHFERFYLTAETDDIGHTGYRTQVTVDHPVLNGLQLPHIALIAVQRITVNLPRRTIDRLYFRGHTIREVGIVKQVIHLLARGKIIHPVFENNVHYRKPEQRRGTDIRLIRDRIHRDLDRDGHELLHLLRTAAGPLRNDGNLRIGNIRESINRGMHETDRSGDNGDRRQEKDKKTILERKRDNVVDKLVHPDLF